MMDRITAIQRVVGAVEKRDFTGITDDQMALADNEVANKLYRQWVAGGRVPLPADEALDCNTDVLVAVSTVSGFDGHFRVVIDHHVPLALEPGDLIYIRRRTPIRDPERPRG